MAHLKFVTDANGEIGRKAKGMIAKDGEYVEFNYESDCSGPVCILFNQQYIWTKSSATVDCFNTALCYSICFA